jgi:hypothetical protein
VSKAISDRDLRALFRQLNRLVPRGKEIIQTLEIAAAPLVDELKLRAPMKIIRDDIGVISKPLKYPRSIMVGLKYRRGAISNLAYAFEYGTVDRYTKKNQYRGKLQPTPWFRPTVDRMRSEIVTNMKNEVAKLVQNKLKK